MKEDEQMRRWAERELRYYNFSSVLKEFPNPREREAIKAVLEWLSLHLVVGLTRSDGSIVCDMASMRSENPDFIGKADMLVLTHKELREAEVLLVDSPPGER